jgi:hypothetical protein
VPPPQTSLLWHRPSQVALHAFILSGANAVSSRGQQDRLIRIKPNQIFCTIDGCGKPASFVLHRFLGLAKPVRLAYCDEHAEQVARDLRIEMPDED